jgi:hypothetical protein
VLLSATWSGVDHGWPGNLSHSTWKHQLFFAVLCSIYQKRRRQCICSCYVSHAFLDYSKFDSAQVNSCKTAYLCLCQRVCCQFFGAQSFGKSFCRLVTYTKQDGGVVFSAARFVFLCRYRSSCHKMPDYAQCQFGNSSPVVPDQVVYYAQIAGVSGGLEALHQGILICLLEDKRHFMRGRCQDRCIEQATEERKLKWLRPNGPSRGYRVTKPSNQPIINSGEG